MHPDQRAANVNAGICRDGFHRHRSGESIPCGNRKCTACVQLWHNIDDLIAPLFRRGLFQNKRTVQMFAALNRQINTALPQNGIDAAESGLRCIHRGTFSNLFPHHFTGGASNYQKRTELQICLFQKFRHNRAGLGCNIFEHTLSPFLNFFLL